MIASASLSDRVMRRPDLRAPRRLPALPQTAGPDVVLMLFLAAIVGAELFTNVNPLGGLIAHVVIVLALLGFGAYTDQDDQRAVLFALIVVPLIRICSLCLPLDAIPSLYWYAAIMAPVLMAVVVASRTLGFGFGDLGLVLRWDDLWMTALLLPYAIGGGFLEYRILTPAPIIGIVDPLHITLAVAILAVATGLAEEIVFRGLLLHAAFLRLSPWAAILYVTAMFTGMHTGAGSVVDLVFVAGAGGLLGWIRWKTGSIVLPGTLHAAVNITVFVLGPLWLAPALTGGLPR